jgi:hypothetical protein
MPLGHAGVMGNTAWQQSGFEYATEAEVNARVCCNRGVLTGR